MDGLLGTGQEEIALRILAIITFLGTAGIGLHALFHDYRPENGKITRAGIVAALLLVTLAVISIASELVRGNIENRKEAAVDALERSRFDAEMAALRQVTGNLRHISSDLSRVSASASGLEGDMQSSLGQQRIVLERTNRNLRLIGDMSAEARNNASNLLRRIFEEGNRVRLDRIFLTIGYSCLVANREQLQPFTAPHVRAIIRVRAAPVRLTWMRMDAAFTSTTQRVDPRNPPAVSFFDAFRDFLQRSFNFTPQYNIFTDFTGDLTGLDMLDEWRGARVAVSLEGEPDSASPVATGAARCGLEMTLFVNERPVARSGAVVVNLPLQSNYVITFPEVAIDDAMLPRFVDPLVADRQQRPFPLPAWIQVLVGDRPR